MKRKVMVYLCMVFLFSAANGFAERVYLTDGTMVEGEFVNEDEVSVTVKSGKRIKKYYRAQIDRIEESPTEDETDFLNTNLANFPGITPEKVKLIYDFIDSSGVRKAMRQNIERTIDSAPDSERAKYEEMFNIKEIIDLLIPVYDKYYTEDDMAVAVEFYQSAAGQKILEVTPDLMKDTLNVTMQYINGKKE